MFLLPAVLVVLFVSVFPLIVSLYLSLARFKFVKGGFSLQYIGWLNYKKLLFGSQQFHSLGKMTAVGPIGVLVLALAAALIVTLLVRYLRRGQRTPLGIAGRLAAAVGSFALVLLAVRTLGEGGHPGTIIVTLIYVLVGVAVQYAIGLGLALLCIQDLPGRRFFRIVFFLPMMITPVGIAYAFRMLTDTSKGPFFPVWDMLGLSAISWVTNPWGARIAVMIGDSWQWIPFMFIVLLAALESLPRDQFEAALVDGATRRQIFGYVIWPAIVPVSITLVLIRMIEAFKIIDLPNVMTNGGPGIASESLTLHSFMSWRALDLGGSAAIAYMLLFLSVFVCLSFVNLVRPQVAGARP